MSIRYLISVSNIPWTVSCSEFENYFSSFGMIKCAKVIFDKCGLSTGYGFVEFYDKSAMSKALTVVHILEDKKLLIAKGDKYLKEGNVEYFLKEYIERFQSNVRDRDNTEINTGGKYVQKQYAKVRMTYQVLCGNHNYDNVLSVIEQLLKNKQT